MAENRDYSKSAVDLTNPPQVKALLDELHQIKAKTTELEGVLSENETYIQLQANIKQAAEVEQIIKDTIDIFGSYQDVEQGEYALKYRRQSKQYDPAAFKRNYPAFAPAVIVDSVNTKALEGLIKGKLITEDALRLNHVMTTTETTAFVIK